MSVIHIIDSIESQDVPFEFSGIIQRRLNSCLSCSIHWSCLMFGALRDGESHGLASGSPLPHRQHHDSTTIEMKPQPISMITKCKARVQVNVGPERLTYIASMTSNSRCYNAVGR
jgi:hypothetical protein